MSADRRSDGRGSAVEEAELRRAEVPLTTVHLAEAEEPNGRRPATLCGAPVGEPVPDGDVRYCSKCAAAADRWAAAESDAPGEDGAAESVAHPPWCCRERCYLSRDYEDDEDEPIRVHQQYPCRMEDYGAQVRVESQLFGPEDDHRVYLELQLTSLAAPGDVVNRDFGAIWPLEFVRRLRDHLDAHLAAAEQGRRNRVVGTSGHLMTDE